MQIENSPFANMIWFMGVVEDIKDDKGVARVKVRAIGFHTENRSAVSHNDLPWATFATSGADTNAPMCKPGDWVIGFFLDNTEAQQPVVLAKLHGFTPANKDKTTGFSDPDGVYPRTTNAPTTSELSRGVANTVVQYKKDTVAKSVATADGTTWNEPATAFGAVYPNNYVVHTDGYNIIELDDTEGKERVHVFHHNGSFFEFHPSGDVVQRTLGGHFLMAYNGMRIYVNGDASVSATGNASLAANKNVNISAGQTISLQAKDIILGATNSITTGSATLTLGATGAVKVNGASMDLGASGSFTIGGASTTIGSEGMLQLNGATVDLGEMGSGSSAGQGASGKIAHVPTLTVPGYKLPYATAT
jgi:hypothetical protein